MASQSSSKNATFLKCKRQKGKGQWMKAEHGKSIVCANVPVKTIKYNEKANQSKKMQESVSIFGFSLLL